MLAVVLVILKFQSTLPCGSDAMCEDYCLLIVEISIHAPLRERPRDLILLFCEE